MAKVIATESGEDVLNADICTYIICKGQYKLLDIIELEFLSKQKKVYSFLSFTWGIIADNDIESEK